MNRNTYIFLMGVKGIVFYGIAITLSKFTVDSSFFFYTQSLVVILTTLCLFSIHSLMIRKSYNYLIVLYYSYSVLQLILLSTLVIFLLFLLFKGINEALVISVYLFAKLIELKFDSLYLAIQDYKSLFFRLTITSALNLILMFSVGAGLIDSSELYLKLIAVFTIAIYLGEFLFKAKYHLVRLVRCSFLKAFSRYKSYLLTLTLTGFAASIIHNVDKVMIKELGYEAQLSSYALNFMLAFFSYKFFTVSYLQYVANNFYKIKNVDYLKRMVVIGAALVVTANVCINILLYYFSGFITFVEIKPEYMLPLSLSSIIAYFYLSNTILCKFKYNAKIIFKSQVIASLISVFGNLTLIPVFGIVSSCYVLIFAYLVCMLFTRKYNPICSIKEKLV